MRFPRDFLNKLKEEINLVDLIGEYTELKKAGPHLYMGHCPHPNHNDSDASFRVNTKTNTFCCYGCHSDKKNKNEGNFGTDCIAFIEWMNDGKLSFSECVKFLANKINLPLPVEEHEEMFKTNYKLMKKYQRDMNDFARDYLTDRDIGHNEIQQWSIGYDKAENRIVFPLYDSYNNIVGFNKRLITKNTKGVCRKYMHSSDNEIFKKSYYLYGLNHIDKDCEYIILTEGVMDCILAQKYGLKNTVCALGTSLSDHQIDLLAKFNKEIIVAYDSDDKGLKTMKKVMGLFDERGISAKLVILPEDKDLADLSMELQHDIVNYINKYKMTYGYYIVQNAIDDFNKELYELYVKYNVIFNTVLEEAPKNEKIILNKYIENNIYNKEMRHSALR